MINSFIKKITFMKLQEILNKFNYYIAILEIKFLKSTILYNESNILIKN